jgi:uncharacterized BrkB/YihY/UPF0761 family membrane protein
MDNITLALLQYLPIATLIALFFSLIYTVYKKKYQASIGIAIMTAAFIVLKYVVSR